MSRSSAYRSGDVAWNGKGLLIMPLPRIVNAASVGYSGGFVAPCAGNIVKLAINITTQFTHADAAAAFGKLSDLDSHLDDYDLTNVATGHRDLTSSLVTAAIVEGEAYTWSLAASDTTGVLLGVVVIEPS